MKRIFLSILTLLLLTGPVGKAQSTDPLLKLAGPNFPALYSKGQDTRVSAIAAMIERAISFHQKSLSLKPSITLMVLDTADWKTYSSKGAVYGMPHYDFERKALIVAAQDNPFWNSFLPSADKLPADLRESFIEAYSNEDGSLSARAFFDLLAIHELGHAFNNEAAINMQRQWMSELYCNIFLHTYIAEKEPALLPALTLFPKLVVSSGAKGFKYTSLKDLQENYNDVATKYPRNYGWYQCRWHVAAGEIYDRSGKKACKKIWEMFRKEKNTLNDEALMDLFKHSGNRALAEFVSDWEKNTRL